MSEDMGKSTQDNSATFRDVFFPSTADDTFFIRVPDYQRAFAWEQKQIDLFIDDLVRYKDRSNEYYFGHFIAEKVDGGWDIVDGQQRLTTFMLFLMVCKVLSSSAGNELSPDNEAYSFIERFSTVSYDNDALRQIGPKLDAFGHQFTNIDPGKLEDDKIIDCFEFDKEGYTLSQRRIVQALHLFRRAFDVSRKLCEKEIGKYIQVIMSAHCSVHLTTDTSVAVNIFEMQNTRGVPLTTFEIVKAKLMKFVYDNSDNKSDDIEVIRESFGKIYKMEELLSSSSFRGDMSMEHLLRLHLRAVDDGSKTEAWQFKNPASNASSDKIVEYVDLMLHYQDVEKKTEKEPSKGVTYAKDLAKEFGISVRIACEALPAWDKDDSLVGDVLILDRNLSYQFFFLVCRLFESEEGKADGRVGKDVLRLWERLVFTRDFHDCYHNLKGQRDNFPALFAGLFKNLRLEEESPTVIKAAEEAVVKVIEPYLKDGFRPHDKTKGLQTKVANYLQGNVDHILNGAFGWWRHKMIYAIYKYEIDKEAKLRDVMKGTISVEHILPQDWKWEWVNDEEAMKLGEDVTRRKINAYINGIGNLLLITPSDNSALRNEHPKNKCYKNYYDANCKGGNSYEKHDSNPEVWESSGKWCHLIHDRGEKIYNFMLKELVGMPSEKTEGRLGADDDAGTANGNV